MGRVRVTATIDQVKCVRQSEGAPLPPLDPTSEPYLWGAMFVVDGFQVLIVDPPNFTMRVPEQPLEIQVNQGNHGNLFAAGSPFATDGVKNGDVIAVPAAAGFFRTFVRRMELPPPCDPLLPEGVHGLAGVVALLLEHDSLSEADAERGHQAFNQALAELLTDFVDGRSILAGGPDEAEMDAMAAEIEERVKEAIASGFGATDILKVVAGPDHSLGNAVFTFPIETLLSGRRAFSETLTERAGNEWVVSGSAHAIDDCLVNAFNGARVARGAAPLDDAPLRAVRAGLTPRTGRVVRDALGAAGPPIVEVLDGHPDLEQQAAELFRRFGEIAGDGDASRRIPESFVAEARSLAERLAAAAPAAQRREVVRLAALLPLAAGRTIGELRALAEANPGLFTGSVKGGPR